jgi:hypothetical protein
MRWYLHGMPDSATALFLGAASAALGRSLLSVAFGAASAAFCRAASSHHTGSREETDNADPCQELLEFL